MSDKDFETLAANAYQEKRYTDFIALASKTDLSNEYVLCNLFLCYFKGLGIAKDYELSRKYLMASIKKRFLRAVEYYMMIGNYILGTKFEIAAYAVKNGVGGASFYLAECYKDGDGCQRDSVKAVKYFEQSIREDFLSEFAAHECAELLYNGNGCRVDYNRAFKYFKMAADNGHKYSYLGLARCYELGRGCTKDPNAAYRWIAKAASEDVREAEIDLARCYEKGIGVPLDLDKAIILYGATGLVKSRDELSRLGKTSFDAAMLAFSKQDADNARLGIRICNAKILLDPEYPKLPDDKTCRLLGCVGDCYFKGNGVKQNYTKSLEYYKRAANLNIRESAYAMRKIAECYENGLGVEVDTAEAKKWENEAEIKENYYDIGDSLRTKYAAQISDCKAWREAIDSIVDNLNCMYSFYALRKVPFAEEERVIGVSRLSQEKLYFSWEGVPLFETISSTNTNYRFVGRCKLFVTNCKIAFSLESSFTSIPFGTISSLSFEWQKGDWSLLLSRTDRVRTLCFRLKDFLWVWMAYRYFYNLSFKRMANEFLTARYGSQAQRKFVEYIVEQIKPSLDRALYQQRQEEVAKQQKTDADSLGCGCFCVVAIAIAALFLWVIAH